MYSFLPENEKWEHIYNIVVNFIYFSKSELVYIFIIKVIFQIQYNSIKVIWNKKNHESMVYVKVQQIKTLCNAIFF